jgi:hypothetical protein
MNTITNKSNEIHKLKIVPGEIRVLVENDDLIERKNISRIVVVMGDHSHVDGTYTVALLDSLYEIATDRDFLIPTNLSSAPFPLALWIDFTVRVLKEQLENSPVIGLLNSSWLRKAENLAAVLFDQGFEDTTDINVWQIGEYRPIFGDKVWAYRSGEMDVLNEFAVPMDPESTTQRFLMAQTMIPNDNQSFSVQIHSRIDAEILVEQSVDLSRCVMV